MADLVDWVVERQWRTEAGLPAAVVIVRGRHRCGYVGVPNTNSLYGRDYSDLDVDCHWGLSWGQHRPDYPVAMDTKHWWFGFDCIHYGDGDMLDNPFGYPVRSLSYCSEQCESIAAQLMGLSGGMDGEGI